MVKDGAQKNDSAIYLSAHVSASDLRNRGRFARSNVVRNKKKKFERTDVWKATTKPEKYFPHPHIWGQPCEELCWFFVLTCVQRAVALRFYTYVERAKNHEFSTEYGRISRKAFEESHSPSVTRELRERTWMARILTFQMQPYGFVIPKEQRLFEKNHGIFAWARINLNSYKPGSCYVSEVCVKLFVEIKKKLNFKSYYSKHILF